MSLKPLQQWYCDSCREIIKKPEDGWVHWRKEKRGQAPTEWGVHSIEILHRAHTSPRGEGGCFRAPIEKELHLSRFLGPEGIARLVSMMDVGVYHDPDRLELVGVKDIRNWAEVFRRLHLPYYEEARRYFDRARADGTLDAVDEIELYHERILHDLVSTYGGDES